MPSNNSAEPRCLPDGPGDVGGSQGLAEIGAEPQGAAGAIGDEHGDAGIGEEPRHMGVAVDRPHHARNSVHGAGRQHVGAREPVVDGQPVRPAGVHPADHVPPAGKTLGQPAGLVGRMAQRQRGHQGREPPPDVGDR
jgi:hypothetical protein